MLKRIFLFLAFVFAVISATIEINDGFNDAEELFNKITDATPDQNVQLLTDALNNVYSFEERVRLCENMLELIHDNARRLFDYYDRLPPKDRRVDVPNETEIKRLLMLYSGKLANDTKDKVVSLFTLAKKCREGHKQEVSHLLDKVMNPQVKSDYVYQLLKTCYHIANLEMLQYLEEMRKRWLIPFTKKDKVLLNFNEALQNKIKELKISDSINNADTMTQHTSKITADGTFTESGEKDEYIVTENMENDSNRGNMIETNNFRKELKQLVIDGKVELIEKFITETPYPKDRMRMCQKMVDLLNENQKIRRSISVEHQARLSPTESYEHIKNEKQVTELMKSCAKTQKWDSTKEEHFINSLDSHFKNPNIEGIKLYFNAIKEPQIKGALAHDLSKKWKPKDPQILEFLNQQIQLLSLKHSIKAKVNGFRRIFSKNDPIITKLQMKIGESEDTMMDSNNSNIKLNENDMEVKLNTIKNAKTLTREELKDLVIDGKIEIIKQFIKESPYPKDRMKLCKKMVDFVNENQIMRYNPELQPHFSLSQIVVSIDNTVAQLMDSCADTQNDDSLKERDFLNVLDYYSHNLKEIKAIFEKITESQIKGELAKTLITKWNPTNAEILEFLNQQAKLLSIKHSMKNKLNGLKSFFSKKESKTKNMTRNAAELMIDNEHQEEEAKTRRPSFFKWPRKKSFEIVEENVLETKSGKKLELTAITNVIHAIESKGMNKKYLYAIQVDDNEVERLMKDYIQSNISTFNEIDGTQVLMNEQWDVYTLANLLVHILKDLKNPIISKDLQTEFFNFYGELIIKFHLNPILKKFPEFNLKMLAQIMQHLNKVTKLKNTEMNAKKLSAIFREILFPIYIEDFGPERILNPIVQWMIENPELLLD